MIKKERKKPIKLKKLEVLQKRLPEHHPKKQKVNEDLAKNIAGYNGEKAVDYYLTFINDDYHILHNLRLKDHKSRYFQLDTVIHTSNFIITLEIKNIMGQLFFDQEFHQLIRIYQNQQDGFSDPLLQIKRQKEQLQSWLSINKFPFIPIIPLVIISSPSSIIQTNENSLKLSNVLHSAFLPEKIQEIERKYKRSILTKKELNSLTRRLIKKDEPLNPDIVDLYGIERNEIIKGVICEKCSNLMRRIWGTWECLACFYRSRNAHFSAINDYTVLFGNQITNSQLRDFLQIDSESIARKILSTYCIDSFGQNKNRIYVLPEWEE